MPSGLLGPRSAPFSGIIIERPGAQRPNAESGADGSGGPLGPVANASGARAAIGTHAIWQDALTSSIDE